MRSLILVAAASLALAACDDGTSYPTADNAATNADEVTYRSCPDGSVIRQDEPCPTGHEGQTQQP